METQRQAHLDPKRYARAHDVIQKKHSVLPPEVVERLAREAVARLAALRVVDAVGADEAEDPKVVDAFCDVLLVEDAAAALNFLQIRFPPSKMRHSGVYFLIAAAARQLGSRWDADQVTFVQVTTSIAKLYALVRSISRNRLPLASIDGEAALFASVPGEQHTLGVTIAAELFRDGGWEIDLQIGRTLEELVAHAIATQPPAIGLSLYNRTHLPNLARLTDALRLALPDMVIAVAGGGDTTVEMLEAAGRFDLIVVNAKQAQVELAELIHSRRNS